MSYNSVESINEYFASKGSRILAIIRDDKEHEFTEFKNKREKVKWVCAENPTHISTSMLDGILRNDKDRLMCRGCAISAALGGVTYEQFCKLLEEKGWKMISTKHEYKNSKTLMNVKCVQGHEFTTSQNRFNSEHGCKQCDNQKKRRHGIEDVREEFKQKGFTLLAKEYVNNATPLHYRCKCGRERYISYTNFCHNIDGCKFCTRRWTPNNVEDYMEEQGCKLVSAENDAEFILNATRITYICFCGNEYSTSWRMFKEGARCYECTREMIRQTCLKIYGVDNPSKSDEVKERIRETMLERYGVEWAMQYKEFCDKAKETNIRRNGGMHNLTKPEIRKMASDAFEDKYKTTLGRVPEIQEKSRETTRKRYGVDYPLQSKEIQEKIKISNLERYGVENSMQRLEVFAKAQKSAFSLKSYTLPSGKIINIQGYESFAVDKLLLEVEEEDIITGCENIPIIHYIFEDKNHVYYPDIYIPSKNLLIEIKSSYTYEKDYDKNQAKFTSAALAGYTLTLWIFSPKGVLIHEEVFTPGSLVSLIFTPPEDSTREATSE